MLQAKKEEEMMNDLLLMMLFDALDPIKKEHLEEQSLAEVKVMQRTTHDDMIVVFSHQVKL